MDRIADSIKKNNLNRVIVAACSPATHLRFFQDAARRAGLNPYLVEMANIRNLDTWVHNDRKVATEKAKDMIRMAVAKAPLMRPFRPGKLSIVKRALVIGCGPAGLAAIDALANADVETIVVELGDRCGGPYLNDFVIKYLPEGIRAKELVNKLIRVLETPGLGFIMGPRLRRSQASRVTST